MTPTRTTAVAMAVTVAGTSMQRGVRQGHSSPSGWEGGGGECRHGAIVLALELAHADVACAPLDTKGGGSPSTAGWVF